MIDWIKEKFSSVLSVCFVLYIVLIAIVCGVFGFQIDPFTGTALGLLIGTVVGILSGIFIFGLCATIISIAQSNDFILEYLRDISKKTKTKIKFHYQLPRTMTQRKTTLLYGSAQNAVGQILQELTSAKNAENKYLNKTQL